MIMMPFLALKTNASLPYFRYNIKRSPRITPLTRRVYVNSFFCESDVHWRGFQQPYRLTCFDKLQWETTKKLKQTTTILMPSSCSWNSIQHLQIERQSWRKSPDQLSVETRFNIQPVLKNRNRRKGERQRVIFKTFGPKNSSLIVEFVLNGIHLPRIIDMKIVNPITYSNQTISSHQCSFSSLHRMISHSVRDKR